MPKLYLDPEDDLTGHIDASFDMPSIADRSCPACDEELHRLFNEKCIKHCPCCCHDEE